MRQPKNDLRKSLVALDQHKTVVAVVELGSRSWLVGGVVPGIGRDPTKKLPPDEHALLQLLHRWRDQAIKVVRSLPAGNKILNREYLQRQGRAEWFRERRGQRPRQI